MILSSDNAFNKIMEINPVRAVVYYEKVSEINIINRKNKIDCIDFKMLSKRLKKDLENLKKGSETL